MSQSKFLVLVCGLCLLGVSVLAQEKPILSPTIEPTIAPVPLPSDSIPAIKDAMDSLKISPIDSVIQDSVKVAKKGDIETTVDYKSNDSIFFDIRTRQIFMYGEAEVRYGDIELDAEYIDVNWMTKNLKASGRTDSLGRKIGYPIFKEGDQEFKTVSIKYNFDTKRALIDKVITQDGEAYMHGEHVKKNEYNELLIDHAKYTTCNLEHPHFHIAASKLKVIPNDKIIAGPFNLVFNDIPTPLGFPFAMFPAPKKRANGIIMPSYGEERLRGFFLRNGGYFMSLGEFATVALLGEIYSKGSAGLTMDLDYRKRYKFDGRMNFRFNEQRIGQNIEDSTKQRDYWITWSHTPQSKGTGRLSANVSAGTSTYNQNNMVNMNQFLQQEFQSNVTYSKVFPGTPFNMTVSARQRQNVRTKESNVQLPELSLNMNRQFPFKNLPGKNDSWYKKLQFGYTFVTTNNISNRGLTGFSGLNVANKNPLDEELLDFNRENFSTILARSQNGARHQIPLQTSFKAFKHFVVTPQANYEEVWYLRSLNFEFIDSLNAVRVDTIPGFSRAGSFNTGASISTIIYGTYYPKSDVIKGVRHMMTPSVGFNYRPDFSDPRYGIFQEVQTDTLGRTRMLSRYEQFAFGSPGLGRSAAISFNVNNNLELKVRDKSDTVTGTKKIAIFDNFSFSGGYDMLRDSFQLSDISFSARTRLFNGKLDINISGAMDPYQWESIGSEVDNRSGETFERYRRVNRLAVEAGQGLGRISRATLALGTNLNPKKRDKVKERLDDVDGVVGFDRQYLEFLAMNPDLYVDWDVPWNVNVRYNLNYSRTPVAPVNITQAFTFSGDVNFTPKWKVGFNSGYDLQLKDFTQTRINVHRDLHCWELRFDWTPFGFMQSYMFTLNVKASVLQDLKLNRTRSFFDR